MPDTQDTATDPTPTSTVERLLTAVDVANLLTVPESWVREATREGRLPHLRLGRYIRYQRQAILDWLEDHKHGPQPARRQR